jgi:membrane fusion protein (multidrug efflux system)
VRIEIDANDLKKFPLRIGLSSTVKVDTHDRSGSVLAAAPSTRPMTDTNVYTRDMTQGAVAADKIIAKNLRVIR